MEEIEEEEIIKEIMRTITLDFPPSKSIDNALELAISLTIKKMESLKEIRK